MSEVKVLIDEQKLQKRIEEVALEIMNDYKDEEIVLLCVLKGAIFFTVDLAKKIKNKLKIEFIKVSSYGEEQVSSGKVEIQDKFNIDIKNQNVIIVEDIVDSGYTIQALKQYLKDKEAKTVKVAALLNKPDRREISVNIDYMGFEIANKFIVGYGLDDKDYDRNIPYIGYI